MGRWPAYELYGILRRRWLYTGGLSLYSRPRGGAICPNHVHCAWAQFPMEYFLILNEIFSKIKALSAII